MSKLVASVGEALAGIRKLNASVNEHPELAERLGQAHAYYVLEEPDGGRLFGFSKFVGYQDMTAERYLQDYKELDGRNTEFALSRWFEEVRPGSPPYVALHAKLSDWLAEYGKRPRGGKDQQVRLMVLRQEFRDPHQGASEDRKLLDLLIAVADTLPAHQRHELRAAL